MRGTPFECSSMFHGTRGERQAAARVEQPDTVVIHVTGVSVDEAQAKLDALTEKLAEVKALTADVAAALDGLGLRFDHGTRREICASTAQVKPPESVCECLINLLNENPAEKDVIAIFRGWASINDVRAKMGLEPDVLPYSAQKRLLNPCSYSMELGETLCKEIVGGMANSAYDDESSFGVQCLIDYAFKPV